VPPRPLPGGRHTPGCNMPICISPLIRKAGKRKEE
jgi:hypothetical protein